MKISIEKFRKSIEKLYIAPDLEYQINNVITRYCNKVKY